MSSKELEFQKRLRDFLKHYRMVTGKSKAHIAEDIGISYATLHRLMKEPRTTRKWATIWRVLITLQPSAINPDALKLGVKEVPKQRRAA